MQIISLKKISHSRKSHSKDNPNKSKKETSKTKSGNNVIQTEPSERDINLKNDNPNNIKRINELNIKINNLLKENKEKDETIEKMASLEYEIKSLKEQIVDKNNNINKLNEKIKTLSKKQIIEHRTIVDDDEFNLLVDENEDLKRVNKDLVDKLNFLTKQRKNAYQNEQIINQQKEEISNLNKKYNQIYYELNQYKDKNYQLNAQIRNLKSGYK